MLGYLYGKRFSSKIAWANRKKGDRVGAGPSPSLMDSSMNKRTG
jgi:hypothetical protein